MEQPMRLTYNYTTEEHVYYNEAFEDIVLFGSFDDEEDEDEMKPFISKGDAYSTFDVSHWTVNDLEDFAKHHTVDQVAKLEGLTEITS